MGAPDETAISLRAKVELASSVVFLVASIPVILKALGADLPSWAMALWLIAAATFIVLRVGMMIADDLAAAMRGTAYRSKSGCLLAAAGTCGIFALLHLAFRNHERWLFVGFWVGLAVLVLVRLLIRHVLRMHYAATRPAPEPREPPANCASR